MQGEKLLILSVVVVWIPGSLGRAWSAAIVGGGKRHGLRAVQEKGVSYAKGHAWLCETVGHSSAAREPVPGSRCSLLGDVQDAPAHGSRFQAPGPDRCKHGLTAHRGAVPACLHLTQTAEEATLRARGQTAPELAAGKREDRERERERERGMEQGEGKSALGNDFMLVRAVHISGKKKTVASRLTCLNIVYILFLLFAVPNCGSCHQRCVHSGGSA